MGVRAREWQKRDLEASLVVGQGFDQFFKSNLPGLVIK